MRLAIGTALSLALLVSACGDSGNSQQNVTSISVRSAEQNALHKLSPMNQKIALRRALYDSGRACQTVTEAGYVQEYGRSCSSAANGRTSRIP